MDGLKNHTTVAKYLKSPSNCLFAAQVKGVESHGFPFHFVYEGLAI